MGPYSEKKQLERAESVKKLLERNDLSEWARTFWSKVVRDLAHDEFTYNHRVVNAYGKDFRPISVALGKPPWPIDRF
jgi:hypothetical protein